MESFFLSETCKYLYLLFDEENPVNQDARRFIFTTEGHLFPLNYQLREKFWSTREPQEAQIEEAIVVDARRVWQNNSESSCKKINADRKFLLPLRNEYFQQVSEALGLS